MKELIIGGLLTFGSFYVGYFARMWQEWVKKK